MKERREDSLEQELLKLAPKLWISNDGGVRVLGWGRLARWVGLHVELDCECEVDAGTLSVS